MFLVVLHLFLFVVLSFFFSIRSFRPCPHFSPHFIHIPHVKLHIPICSFVHFVFRNLQSFVILCFYFALSLTLSFQLFLFSDNSEHCTNQPNHISTAQHLANAFAPQQQQPAIRFFFNHLEPIFPLRHESKFQIGITNQTTPYTLKLYNVLFCALFLSISQSSLRRPQSPSLTSQKSYHLPPPNTPPNQKQSHK